MVDHSRVTSIEGDITDFETVNQAMKEQDLVYVANVDITPDNQLVEYIVHNGMMKDLSVLQESPFTDRGSVVEIFTDLTVWMGIRKVIDQINANAAA